MGYAVGEDGLSVQDADTLDASTLTPLSPEVISRQATINIGTCGVGGARDAFPNATTRKAPVATRASIAATLGFISLACRAFSRTRPP